MKKQGKKQMSKCPNGRHISFATPLQLFNYETVSALLGHSNMSATAVYAERNQGLAGEAARKLG